MKTTLTIALGILIMSINGCKKETETIYKIQTDTLRINNTDTLLVVRFSRYVLKNPENENDTTTKNLINIDINNDSRIDFSFKAFNVIDQSGKSKMMNLSTSNGYQIAVGGCISCLICPVFLKVNDSINITTGQSNPYMLGYKRSWNNSAYVHGENAHFYPCTFYNEKDNYIPFKLLIGDNTNFGYLKVYMSPDSIVIKSYVLSITNGKTLFINNRY